MHGPKKLEFEIDISSSFAPEVLENLRENVRIGFAWASSHASDMIRRILSSGRLLEGDEHAERAYRNRVMAEMFSHRHRPRWLTPWLNSSANNVIDIEKSEFSVDELTNYLMRLEPSPPDFSGTPRALRQ